MRAVGILVLIFFALVAIAHIIANKLNKDYVFLNKKLGDQNELLKKSICFMRSQLFLITLKECPEEEKPIITNNVKKNNQLIIDEYIFEINNSSNIEFIKELKTTYRQKSIELRERHAKLKEMLKDSTNSERKIKIKNEMNNIARRVNAYDQIFVAARDRLFELKQTKNQIKK